MQPNEMIQETQKTLNLLNDIHEIDAILIQEQNGFGLDRQKAQTVIQKHNMTDSTIGFINNCTPNRVPLVYATDDVLRNNLNMIRDYLYAKRAKELLEKGSNHHADT